MSADKTVIEIANPELKKAILQQIKAKKKGFARLFLREITKEDAANLTYLNFKNISIENLDFLVHFPALEMLFLSNVSGLQNVEGAVYCTKMDAFLCSNTYIEDMRPFLAWKELKAFDYVCENVKENSNRRTKEAFFFLKELPELRDLDLSGNLIQDVSFLSECKNLAYIAINENPIGTIAPLKVLPKLTNLEVELCSLKALEDLEQFPAIKNVMASGNAISEADKEMYRQRFEHLESFDV